MYLFLFVAYLITAALGLVAGIAALVAGAGAALGLAVAGFVWVLLFALIVRCAR